jgi:hypothetical protein
VAAPPAVSISALTSRSKYSPQAMIGFWKRLQNTDAYPEKEIRLNRNFTPRQRVLMLEELMPQIPEWSKQEADSNES